MEKARWVALAAMILFSNSFGVVYNPPLWIRAKIEEPFIDTYIVPEPEIEMPVVVTAWNFPVDFPNDAVEHNDYVSKYGAAANRGKIPATIKLAQGILESDYGTSDLAVRANNHFGIKCHSRMCRPGHCINKTDDSHKDFFVKFSSAEGSYRAHDLVLTGKDRYQRILKIPCTDAPIKMVYDPSVYWRYSNELKGKTVYWNGRPMKAGATYTLPGKAWWCIHLCAAGYATDEHYAEKLWKIIQEHDL